MHKYNGHIVPISPRIAGTVIAVLVEDNQYVTAGTELVRLDPADYKVALDKAKADLADAEAQMLEAESNVPITSIETSSQIKTTSAAVIEARAGVTSAQQQVNAANARLASAKAKVAEAQANSEKAQKDLVRFKTLVDKDEISKQQYDSAVAAAQAMAAQVDTVQAGVTEALHNVDVAKAKLGQAHARLNSAQVGQRQSQQSAPKQQAAIEARYKAAQATVQQKQTAIEQANLNLGYTAMRAPVSGLVSKKNAEPGMIVAPGQELMALVPLDDIWVTANFKETQLNRMRVGQQVEIDVDAYGGRTYRGHSTALPPLRALSLAYCPPKTRPGTMSKWFSACLLRSCFDPGQNQPHSPAGDVGRANCPAQFEVTAVRSIQAAKLPAHPEPARCFKACMNTVCCSLIRRRITGEFSTSSYATTPAGHLGKRDVSFSAISPVPGYFHEDLLQFRVDSLNFHPWGFKTIEINREALAGGDLAIDSASGIFPDGCLRNSARRPCSGF